MADIFDWAAGVLRSLAEVVNPATPRENEAELLPLTLWLDESERGNWKHNSYAFHIVSHKEVPLSVWLDGDGWKWRTGGITRSFSQPAQRQLHEEQKRREKAREAKDLNTLAQAILSRGK